METNTIEIEDRILEPLCKATQTILKPLQPPATEFLVIDVDPEIERFVIQSSYLYDSAPSYFSAERGHFTIQHLGQTKYCLPTRSSYCLQQMLKRIPERIDLKDNRYKVAGTDFSVLVIQHAWPKKQIHFKTQEAKLLFDFLLKRFFNQNNRALLQANYKVHGQVPTMPADYIDHPTLPLSGYQKTALMCSLDNPSYCLFMEQRTGKTPVVISRINLEGARLRANKNKMYRALIVCPQHTRRNWEKEFERFSTVPGKISVCRGGQLERVKCLVDGYRNEEDCAWSACIISVDSVDSTWDAIRRVPWDLVVVDESHGIKNPNSKRFAALKMMNSLPVKAKSCLTGTPIANTLFDIWSQLEFAGKGLSGFMSYTNFRRFHGKFERREGSPVEKLTGISGIPLIQERLARMSFLLSKKDSGMQLPERVEEIWEVEMTPKQIAIYNKVAAELVVEIEEMLDRASEEGTASIVAENILTKLLRLAQICSGHVTVELSDGSRRIQQVDVSNPKADELINILKEDAEQDSKSKSIVWCIWDEDERIISERLHKAGIKHVGYNHNILPQYRVKDAYEAELRYNRDHDTLVFVGKPQSGGTGLDLVGYNKDMPESSDRYTGRVINYSCNWSSVDRRQSEERPFSRGARARISITELMVSGTMDEEIRERVKGKIAMANNIQNIRTILESLKGSI